MSGICEVSVLLLSGFSKNSTAHIKPCTRFWLVTWKATVLKMSQNTLINAVPGFVTAWIRLEPPRARPGVR